MLLFFLRPTWDEDDLAEFEGTNIEHTVELDECQQEVKAREQAWRGGEFGDSYLELAELMVGVKAERAKIKHLTVKMGEVLPLPGG